MLETEFAVPLLFKLLPFIFTLLFSILVILLSEYLFELIIGIKLSRLGYIIFGFFNQRFLIEYFYNKFVTKLTLNLGGQTTGFLDNGSIELIGPYGLEKMLIHSSKNIVSLSTGVVTNYALYILIGFCSYALILSLNIDSIVYFMGDGGLIGVEGIISLMLIFIPSILNILEIRNNDIIINNNSNNSNNNNKYYLLNSSFLPVSNFVSKKFLGLKVKNYIIVFFVSIFIYNCKYTGLEYIHNIEEILKEYYILEVIIGIFGVVLTFLSANLQYTLEWMNLDLFKKFLEKLPTLAKLQKLQEDKINFNELYHTIGSESSESNVKMVDENKTPTTFAMNNSNPDGSSTSANNDGDSTSTNNDDDPTEYKDPGYDKEDEEEMDPEQDPSTFKSKEKLEDFISALEDNIKDHASYEVQARNENKPDIAAIHKEEREFFEDKLAEAQEAYDK